MPRLWSTLRGGSTFKGIDVKIQRTPQGLEVVPFKVGESWTNWYGETFTRVKDWTPGALRIALSRDGKRWGWAVKTVTKTETL